MSLPAFFFDRVTADIRQQMDGVLALTEQLSRQRLTPDAQARVREVDSRFGLEVAIGAMLARQIVEGLGGKLSSEGGSGGAETVVFEIILPLATEAPAEQPQAAERSVHVLVVDDNATNRMVA